MYHKYWGYSELHINTVLQIMFQNENHIYFFPVPTEIFQVTKTFKCYIQTMYDTYERLFGTLHFEMVFCFTF
jgi:hypothetical protein